MISQPLLFQFLAGVLGGVLGETFVFLNLRQRARQDEGDHRFRALVISGAGLITVLNLTYLERLPFDIGVSIHYGLFIALLAEHIYDAMRTVELRREEVVGRRPIARLSIALAATPLVLTGFWQVFAVGTFGALLMELRILYRDRKKKLSFRTSYWVITALAVISGGILAVLHGIESVSALLALQLGASAPLLGDQLWKGEKGSDR